jgi:hypothetical protein
MAYLRCGDDRLMGPAAVLENPFDPWVRAAL